MLDNAKANGVAVAQSFESRDYARALRDIMAVADSINGVIAAAAPWTLAKDESKHEELQEISSFALHGFYELSILLSPVFLH